MYVSVLTGVSIGVYGYLWVTWVFIGVWVFMGVYRYLRESMGFHGFSDVSQRQRVLRRTAAAKESLPSIYRRFKFLCMYRC